MYGKAIAGIFLALLAGLSISRSDQISDFRDYYQAAEKFRQKEDIYAVEGIWAAQKKIHSFDEIFQAENFQFLLQLTERAGSYIYPPTFAFLLIPLTLADYEQAAFVFSVLNFFCFIGILVLLWIFFIPKTDSKIFWNTLAITLLVCFRFLENHINNNQVSFLLIFLVLLSVLLKTSWMSGLFFSLAIVIKLTPAVFLIYFFWDKRYWVVFWSFVFLIFWIFLPGVFFWEENLRHLENWNAFVLESALKNPLFRAWQNNQSIIATLAKYFLEYADPVNQPLRGMPWLNLQPVQVQYLFYTIFASFGVSLLWTLQSDPSREKVLSLLWILSVLFSGISWLHSFSVLIFPVFFATKEWLEGGLSSFQKKLLFLVFFLFLVTNRNLIGNSLESWALMLSVFLYGGVILYVLILSIHSEDMNFQKPRIRVAVDARPLAYGMTGNSRYLSEVLKILGKQSHRFEFHLYSHKGIHPIFRPLLQLPGIFLITEQSFLPGPVWLHTVFLLRSFSLNSQVLWGTLQILPAFGKYCRMIVNFHDLNVKSAPQTMDKWNYLQHFLFCRRTLKQADSILCLSRNTIQDIALYFPSYAHKTLLVYPGVSRSFRTSRPKRADSFGNFLFTVGTLEPRKNLKTLVNAYLRLRKNHPLYPYSLVVAGRTGWGKEEARIEEKLKQGFYEQQKVFFLENPSEDELTWLYKNCSAFLFPSLHEGFGLPLLEAMQENKFCIASDIPVFREICDPKQDILVPPLDESAWMLALEQFAKRAERRRVWNPKNWTWENPSRIIASEIEKI